MGNLLSKAALIDADSNVDINDFFYTPQVSFIFTAPLPHHYHLLKSNGLVGW